MKNVYDSLYSSPFHSWKPSTKNTCHVNLFYYRLSYQQNVCYFGPVLLKFELIDNIQGAYKLSEDIYKTIFSQILNRNT